MAPNSGQGRCASVPTLQGGLLLEVLKRSKEAVVNTGGDLPVSLSPRGCPSSVVINIGSKVQLCMPFFRELPLAEWELLLLESHLVLCPLPST